MINFKILKMVCISYSDFKGDLNLWKKYGGKKIDKNNVKDNGSVVIIGKNNYCGMCLYKSLEFLFKEDSINFYKVGNDFNSPKVNESNAASEMEISKIAKMYNMEVIIVYMDYTYTVESITKISGNIHKNEPLLACALGFMSSKNSTVGHYVAIKLEN